MGDKIAAKEAVGKAGIPLVPGSDGEVRSIEEARAAAEKDRLSRSCKGRIGRRRARHETGADGG